MGFKNHISNIGNKNLTKPDSTEPNLIATCYHLWANRSPNRLSLKSSMPNDNPNLGISQHMIAEIKVQIVPSVIRCWNRK